MVEGTENGQSDGSNSSGEDEWSQRKAWDLLYIDTLSKRIQEKVVVKHFYERGNMRAMGSPYVHLTALLPWLSCLCSCYRGLVCLELKRPWCSANRKSTIKFG